jgi:CubicO group peptidase (beta-lactamase class C family)
VTEAWALAEDGVMVESHEADQIVPWWSFTKTVLASAALVLVRDGLMDLDKPLPGQPYTLRHVLQHRSGLAEYGWLPAYHEAVERGDAPWSVPELLARVDANRLRYASGEGWEYSNIGYLFVRQMIGAITGEELGDALKRLVLHPLGIEGATIALKPEDLAHVSMGSASSYHPGWVYHGLMIGSVKDAAVLLQRLMSGVLLPPESLRMMLEPFALSGPVEGRPWKQPGYGLGVMTGEITGGMKVAGHTGGGPGSTIAVYQVLNRSEVHRTAAFFTTSQEQSRAEEKAFEFLRSRGSEFR